MLAVPLLMLCFLFLLCLRMPDGMLDYTLMHWQRYRAGRRAYRAQRRARQHARMLKQWMHAQRVDCNAWPRWRMLDRYRA